MARLTFALPLALAASLVAAPAWACGGFFCMRMPMDQAGEKILFIQDGGQTTAHVQIQYQGEARKFSWVVPTPTEPKLGVGSDALFSLMERGTRPTFDLTMKELGRCDHPILYETRAAAPAGAVQRSREDGVEVVSRAQVGPYDSAVIRSNDPAALKSWLRKNGYEVPPKLDPLLDPYVAGGYYFVALKLQQDRAAGDLQPITLKYRATKPGVPIRLTAVAATPDMDLRVWVLGRDRAVPENYRHARINEAKIDWLTGGSNYRQVVTQAANEAGGQAFVTDYAGKSDFVGLSVFDGERHDTARLAKLRDPVAFLRAIQDDGYFEPGSPTALAFVKRYVPIPKSMKDVWEPAFYSNPEAYRGQLHALGVHVDAPKAAKELEETVVKPYREIKRAFDRHPYLTRMYTTMSPEEMTQDPMFRTSVVLPDVPSVHEADGVRDCRQDHNPYTAPVTITLKDGTRFTVNPKTRPVPPRRFGRPVSDAGAIAELPAAMVIEQLTPDGPPQIIRDNRPAVLAQLAGHDPNAPEPSGNSTGRGIGLAGVLIAGLFGWRRFRK